MDNDLEDEDQLYSYKRLLYLEFGLSKRGLIIENKQEFEYFVGIYGYENIVLKYQNNFLINPNNVESNFIKGTKFSDIKNIFLFDTDLRKEIFSIMQLFELRLENAMINVIENEISDQYSDYTKSMYFKESYPLKGEGGKEYNTITRKKLRNHIKRYRKKAKRDLDLNELIPRMYFGEVENWYFLLDDKIREKVAYYVTVGPLYESKEFDKNQNPTSYIDPMIQLYKGYRNQAAHEGVIYNYYDPKISWPYQGAIFMGKKRFYNNHCCVGLLLLHSFLLTDKSLFHKFADALYNLVSKYIAKNPTQSNILFEMGLDQLTGIDNRFDELIKKYSN